MVLGAKAVRVLGGVVAFGAVACGCAAVASVAGASVTHGAGRLEVRATGVPERTNPRIIVQGGGLSRIVRAREETLLLAPGRYTLQIDPVRVERGYQGIRAGAIAYPNTRKLVVFVLRARTAVVRASYVGVLNPGVRRLPQKILGVLGGGDRPEGLLLPAHVRKPSTGTLFVSGPRAILPRGLIAKVTHVTRQGSLLEVALTPVPMGDAVPLLAYSGDLPLLISRAAAARASAASSSCTSPSLLAFKADLDHVDVTQASFDLIPPQFRLTVDVQTTETLGLAAAAEGIDCNFTLGELGPYSSMIPVGPVEVPVYATFPVTAGIQLSGQLQAGSIQLSSTTVAHVAAGADENAASLTEQDVSVVPTIAPSITGSANLSLQAGMQAGIGFATGANVHVQATFGPVFSWTSGAGCSLDYNLGTLTAGVTILGKSLDTPPFVKNVEQLWTGCKPGSSGASSGPSSGSAPPNRTAITSYDRMSPGAPYHGQFEAAWQPFVAQSNTITSLGVTVGNIDYPAGQPIGFTVPIRLCTNQPDAAGDCNTVGQADPQVVNYGDSQGDIGDVAVNPGQTYWIDYLPPQPLGNGWVTFWWAGGPSIESSDQMQAVVQGYNR
jgi:hypothetical protein